MLRTIAVASVVLITCSCSHQTATSTDGRGTVVRVVDGDTIVVHIGDTDEHVRLIGIDTSKPQKTPLRSRAALARYRSTRARDHNDEITTIKPRLDSAIAKQPSRRRPWRCRCRLLPTGTSRPAGFRVRARRREADCLVDPAPSP